MPDVHDLHYLPFHEIEKLLPADDVRKMRLVSRTFMKSPKENIGLHIKWSGNKPLNNGLPMYECHASIDQPGFSASATFTLYKKEAAALFGRVVVKQPPMDVALTKIDVKSPALEFHADRINTVPPIVAVDKSEGSSTQTIAFTKQFVSAAGKQLQTTLTSPTYVPPGGMAAKTLKQLRKYHQRGTRYEPFAVRRDVSYMKAVYEVLQPQRLATPRNSPGAPPVHDPSPRLRLLDVRQGTSGLINSADAQSLLAKGDLDRTIRRTRRAILKVVQEVEAAQNGGGTNARRHKAI